MITWMRKVNYFQILKVHASRRRLAFASFFCQFQPCVPYKSVVYGKKRLHLQNKQQDEVNMVLSICKDTNFAIV